MPECVQAGEIEPGIHLGRFEKLHPIHPMGLCKLKGLLGGKPAMRYRVVVEADRDGHPGPPGRRLSR